jgi:predicted Zn-dependent protease
LTKDHSSPVSGTTPETNIKATPDLNQSNDEVSQLAETSSIEKDQLVHTCKSAIEKDPLNYWLWKNLCNTYLTHNDYDGAIMACDNGIQQYVMSPSISLLLSNLYATTGQYKEATTIQSQRLFTDKQAILLLALESKDTLPTETSTSDQETRQSLER